MDGPFSLRTGIYPGISPSNLAGHLHGQTALVTGSGRGIGRAIALALAQAGANVAVTARSAAQVSETVQQIVQLSKLTHPGAGTAVGFPGIDVLSLADQTRLVADVRARLGPIDILVCNAWTNTFLPFHRTAAADWWAEVELNLRAPVELARLVLPGMRAMNAGTVIFVSSRAANASLPWTTAYNASKAGLNRFAGTLQAELDVVQTLDVEGDRAAFQENGISVFSIHPGEIETELHETAFRTARTEAPWMVEMMEKKFEEMQLPTFEPELPAWSCVWLCSGKGKAMKGGFMVYTRDVEEHVRKAEEEQGKAKSHG